jgi:Lon protease-like protein
MPNMDTLALFPLDTVLFPGLPLPLHIFEERYKEMIRHCLAEDVPFGVVLIESGPEVGGPATPYRVGTSARIARVERQEGGRMKLVAMGERRFHIEELLEGASYLSARVSWLDTEESEVPVDLVEQVRTGLAGYLDALFRLMDQEVTAFELPDEPDRLAYVTGAILQVSLFEKQRLLEAPSVTARLQAEVDLLARQADVQEVLRRLKPRLGVVTPLDPAVSRRKICLN